MIGVETWRTIAADRNFTDLGDGHWMAYNGQQVSEEFVRNLCVVLEVIADEPEPDWRLCPVCSFGDVLDRLAS